MTDNNDILKAIESIKKDMATKADVQRLEQDLQTVKQARSEYKTVLEAVAAGQKELQETVATRADIQDLRADFGKKVKDHEERIEDLEKDAGIPHPHKH